MSRGLAYILLAIVLLSLVTSSSTFTAGVRKPDIQKGKRTRADEQQLANSNQVCGALFNHFTGKCYCCLLLLKSVNLRGYSKFSFWIPTALAKILISRVAKKTWQKRFCIRRRRPLKGACLASASGWPIGCLFRDSRKDSLPEKIFFNFSLSRVVFLSKLKANIVFGINRTNFFNPYISKYVKNLQLTVRVHWWHNISGHEWFPTFYSSKCRVNVCFIQTTLQAIPWYMTYIVANELITPTGEGWKPARWDWDWQNQQGGSFPYELSVVACSLQSLRACFGAPLARMISELSFTTT